MKNKSWYEWLLAVSFIVMAGFCTWINMFSGQWSGFVSLAINIVMFVIVGVIFLRCDITSFIPTDAVLADLEQAAERIRSDAEGQDEYLWDRYRKGVKLFQSQTMNELYADFTDEVKRLENDNAARRKSAACDIGSYINSEFIDRLMHRNILNQVAGALTGLGILGTFIGLSIGLEGFATGSTAEITESIAPLMSGIKVAFHTSIYGMIFSLVFNYVYKRKLDEADDITDYFLETWRRCVVPESGTGRLAGQDAMKEIVDIFLDEMNRSMSGSFNRMAGIINEESRLQKENADLIRQILDENLVTAKRYTNWLEEQEKTMQNLSKLVGDLPTSMERTARAMQETLEQSRIVYGQMLQQVNAAASQLPQRMSDAYVGLETSLVETTQAVEVLSDRIDSMSKNIATAQVRRKGLFGR